MDDSKNRNSINHEDLIEKDIKKAVSNMTLNYHTQLNQKHTQRL